MNGQFANIKIEGIASAVPSYVMDNMDYIELFGKRRVLKQMKMTGVRRHHMSLRYQKTSDLCMRAANDLIEHLKWKREEIKVLVFCTQSADYEIPSNAIDLSSRLGLSKDCMAFDINLGCSAFDLGIQTVAGLLQSQSDGVKAILLVGDVSSALQGGEVLKKEDVINTMMFGSGGSAIAIEKKPNSKVMFQNYSDGTGWDAILRYRRSKTKMQGNKVFEFAINDVADNIINVKKEFSVREDDIDYYCFHQAQKLILDSVVDTCGLDESKVLSSYEEYGNTSGASIPITLCHNREKFIDRDSVHICSCGFGVGLSIGITMFDICPKNILPIVETDEHFDLHTKHCLFLDERYALLMDTSSEIGQLLGRQLDRSGCNLGLVGNQESNLELREQLFWKDCALYSEGDLSSVLDSENKYDAIIYNMDESEKKKILEDIDFLFQNEALAQNANLVLVAKETENDDELKKYMKDIDEKYGKQIRVNAVVYIPESFDLYPNIGDSMAWVERKLTMIDSQDMDRPFYLANVVNRLVSSKFAGVSQSVIHISDAKIKNS